MDIPAIMFTAVDTEPSTISTEIMGRSRLGATPLFTRIISGMLSVAKLGSSVIAIRPRTAISTIIAFTKKPYTMEVFASSGLEKGCACCTRRPMEANWKAAYTMPVQIALPAGAGLAMLAETLAEMLPHWVTMLGRYTRNRPATISTDRVAATLRTTLVPYTATMKMNRPVKIVPTQWLMPKEVFMVSTPVAKAAAGATQIVTMYISSYRLEKMGAYLP